MDGKASSPVMTDTVVDEKPGNKVLFFILYVLFSLPGCFELFGFASQVFSGFLTCL